MYARGSLQPHHLRLSLQVALLSALLLELHALILRLVTDSPC
jgi:hypothetical protein